MSKKIVLKIATFFISPSIYAAPIISHHNIMPWDDSPTIIEKKFEPAVQFSGCQPYPVINHIGEVSGGLKPTGGRDSGCSDKNKRQVHVRSICFAKGQTDITYGIGSYFVGRFGQGELCAVMYSYYFAKDVGALFGIGGHRHDWESVIVWLRGEHNVVGVSYSGHGQFQKLRGDDADRKGTHPKVDYTYRSGLTELTHSMREGTADNRFYETGLKVNSYSSMSLYRPNLLNALQQHNFGSAVYPQEDSRFAIELNRSWDAAWENYQGSSW